MKHPPTFSVVIPTHNRAGLIQRALQSVAAQTTTDCEIVVVDDGSADATPTVLESLRSPIFRMIRNERSLGVAAARNRGAAVATGELITFLDDDDELRPYALAELLARHRSLPRSDFLWGGRLIHEMDAADRLIGIREDDWSQLPQSVDGSAFLPFVLKIATNSAFTVRRSVLEALGGFDEKLRVSEDRDFFIALARGEYAGSAVVKTIIDVNEGYTSLSRSTGLRSGGDMDLQIIEKHREYLDLPPQREFLNSYLVAVFLAFLQAGNRRSAMRIFSKLHRRRALHLSLIRKYLRHAPEFRTLKSFFRYDAIRRFRNRFKTRPER
jgi:glycosyltransferase involved in cell wall biosynthesis